MYLVCSKHQRSPPDDQIHLSSDILKFEFFLLLLQRVLAIVRIAIRAIKLRLIALDACATTPCGYPALKHGGRANKNSILSIRSTSSWLDAAPGSKRQSSQWRRKYRCHSQNLLAKGWCTIHGQGACKPPHSHRCPCTHAPSSNSLQHTIIGNLARTARNASRYSPHAAAASTSRRAASDSSHPSTTPKGSSIPSRSQHCLSSQASAAI